jgi:GMP synthase-like glutamine amidotransferase
MRIHYLQHVPFEDLANIWIWANERGHSLTSTKLFLSEEPPTTNSFDWLIVMGGPMNVHEEEKYPWLTAEKEFIKRAIGSGKFVLGICLGAQLLADALGGAVKTNQHKEIGWFPVRKTASGSAYFSGLPSEFVAFHWHSDAFEIPPAATRLAESEACANQGFEYGSKVLALQFHLESSEASIQRLVENCSDEMTPGRFVQSQEEILHCPEHLSQINTYLNLLLGEIEKRIITGKTG